MAGYSMPAGSCTTRLDLEDYPQIPDDVADKMLKEASKIVLTAQKKKLITLGHYKTHQLHDSLKAKKKSGKDGSVYYLISPTGNRQPRSNSAKKTANAEVGFVLEFGSPRKHIPASQWMRTANEESADAAAQAQGDVLDKWMDSQGF